MDSMGTMLVNDADFINVACVWMQGKAAAVKDDKGMHEGIKFKTSIWQTDSVAIKYVKSDLDMLILAGVSATILKMMALPVSAGMEYLHG